MSLYNPHFPRKYPWTGKYPPVDWGRNKDYWAVRIDGLTVSLYPTPEQAASAAIELFMDFRVAANHTEQGTQP